MYYSASDADSDGEEGKYFLFNYEESLKDLIRGGFFKKDAKENLVNNRAKLNAIQYPYTLFKPSKDKNFLACKIDACFAIDKNLDLVIEKIEEGRK